MRCQQGSVPPSLESLSDPPQQALQAPCSKIIIGIFRWPQENIKTSKGLWPCTPMKCRERRNGGKCPQATRGRWISMHIASQSF